MIMKSIFVKEQYPYSKADLIRIFGKDDANTCIKKLKEFGVLKTIKKEKRFSDLSELNDVDLVIADEEDTEIERYYVFCFVAIKPTRENMFFKFFLFHLSKCKWRIRYTKQGFRYFVYALVGALRRKNNRY